MPLVDTFVHEPGKYGPLSGNIKAGWAVNPDYSNLPSHNATNGLLQDGRGKQKVGLYVYDITTDISIGGSEAQSRGRRAWYPRHMNQPSYRVKCQCRSQREADYLAEFIRFEQLRTLSGNNADGDEFLTELFVGGGFSKGFNKMGKKVGMNVEVKTPERHDNGKPKIATAAHGHTRGWHNPIWAVGYIKSIQRKAEMGVNAPEVEFEFVIAHATRSDPFPADKIPTPTNLPRWHDVFVADNANGFVTLEDVESSTLKNRGGSGNGGNGNQPSRPHDSQQPRTSPQTRPHDSHQAVPNTGAGVTPDSTAGSLGQVVEGVLDFMTGG